MKQFHIGMCAGHSYRQQGARRQNLTEQPFMRAVLEAAKFIIEMDEQLRERVVIYDPLSDLHPGNANETLNHRIREFKRNPLDLCIDLHMNTHPDKSICEAWAIHANDADERTKQLAEIFAEAMGMGIWQNGETWKVMPEKRLGSTKGFVHYAKYPAIILETCHLSNLDVQGQLLGECEDYNGPCRGEWIVEAGEALVEGVRNMVYSV